MNKPNHSPVIELLVQQGFPYEMIEIPLSEDQKPIRSLEAILTAQQLDPQSVVRSIVFKTEAGQYILLAAAGGARADWAMLRHHLGERKLRMAEMHEVLEATGYPVGAVPPIALPDSVKVLVDQNVNRFTSVVIGSGVLGLAIGLKTQDLLHLLSLCETGQFCKHE